MENQLAILIARYQEEKTRLQVLTKECLEDFEGPDYLLAHYHQKALFKVEHTLRILNRLEDSLYDEKQRNLRLISFYEKDIEKSDSELYKKYLTEQLVKYKKRQEELNSVPKPIDSQNDNQILENTLSQLVSKKIRKFKIVFNKSENVVLSLTTKKGIIKISSSAIKREIIHKSELELLEKLGFTLTNRSRLVLFLNHQGIDQLTALRFLLARIVFDISYFRHPTDENFIEL